MFIRVIRSPKSLPGSAVSYSRKLWPWLNSILLDGSLEISNNRAKRGIKPHVIRRKNFLFTNLPKDEEASPLIYSLIETAKENGPDPYCYLTSLMPLNAPVECRVT